MLRRFKFGIFVKKLFQLSIIVLATLASIFTIFTGVLAFQNIDSFSQWFNKEFQTKQYWLDAANSLSPELNVSFFDKKLGQPVYTSEYKGLTNRTYINDYFYTQAITGTDGSVYLYSITLRKKNFYPDIPYNAGKGGKKLLLGKTTFGDMSEGIDKPIIAGQYLPDFRRGIYSEAYYNGNPGNYLYYFLTINDAGGLGTEYPKLEESAAKAYSFEATGLFDDCSSDYLPMPGNIKNKTGAPMDHMKTARKQMLNAVANTITVTDRRGAVICDYKEIFKEGGPLILGPNLDKVRLFRN